MITERVLAAVPLQSERVSHTGGAVVYRLYDKNRALLYVGLSLNIAQRLGQHHDTPWWNDVAHVEIERCPTRAAAMERERECIQSMEPTFNLQGRKRQQAPKGKVGRPTRYSEAAIQRPVYLPEELLDRIKHEARIRNMRDNTDTWNFSSVVVEIVAEHFGVDVYQREG